MHPQADELLFKAKVENQKALAAFLLVVCVLLANAAFASTLFSTLGLMAALLLLLKAHLEGNSRLKVLTAWIFSLALVGSLSAAALGLNREPMLQVMSRIACGVAWALWLGTMMSWKSFRSHLKLARVPAVIISNLDQSVLHGSLTKTEWRHRRDAARLRAGASHLSLRTWSALFAEGAFSGVERLEKTNQSMALRSATGGATGTTSGTCQLEALSVRRDQSTLLSSITLRLDAGEWVGLCGPSGAGKSTLLKVIAGILEPTSGAMNRFERTIAASTALSRRLDGRVGVLFQNPEHHFIETLVADDVSWGLRQRGVDPAEANLRTRRVTGELHLSHLLERPCYELSFGEQKRVALAGLLVLEPQLLLLDEPTSGLDPVSAQQLQQYVQQYIEQQGATCLWATHDLHPWPDQMKRVLLLRDGSLIFDGPQQEALSETWLKRGGLVPEESKGPL